MRSGHKTAAPGGLPVTLAAPKAAKGGKAVKAAGSVKVNVLDQQATKRLGVKGVALTVTGPKAGGSAELAVDYSKFASAYGGDWAGRLRLVQLSDCALKSPKAAKCHKATPLDLSLVTRRAATCVWQDISAVQRCNCHLPVNCTPLPAVPSEPDPSCGSRRGPSPRRLRRKSSAAARTSRAPSHSSRYSTSGSRRKRTSS